MWQPHPIQWLRDHPRAADGLLAAAAAVAVLAAHLYGESPADDPNEIDPTWWTVVIVLISIVPLAWRRVAPLRVGMIVVSAEVVALFIGMPGAAFVGSVIAVYSIGAHTAGERRTRVMTAIAALVVLLFVVGWFQGLSLLDEFVSTGVVLITAYVLGDNLRRRRQHLLGLAERAERAEREQTLLAEQRVNAERTRIARELHDVVAHSVSVMVIQAAAARRNLDRSSEDVEAALGAIESTGRQTMTELRAILGVLRDESGAGPTLDPQPSLAAIGNLAANDLPVTVTIDGDIESLPDSLSISTYRLVQEALTNVRRHAGPVSDVSVVVRVTDGRLHVEVDDDGRGGAADPSPAGFGLLGMRERVAALGGTVSAGPRPGGGWTVRASVPMLPATAVGSEVRA